MDFLQRAARFSIGILPLLNGNGHRRGHLNQSIMESDHEINNLRQRFQEFVLVNFRFMESCVRLAEFAVNRYSVQEGRNHEQVESNTAVVISRIAEALKWCASWFVDCSNLEIQARDMTNVRDDQARGHGGTRRQNFVDGFNERYNQACGVLYPQVSHEGEQLGRQMVSLFTGYCSASSETKSTEKSVSCLWNIAAIVFVLGIVMSVTAEIASTMMKLAPTSETVTTITVLAPIVTPTTARVVVAIGIAVSVSCALYARYLSRSLKCIQQKIKLLEANKEKLESMQAFLGNSMYFSKKCKQLADGVKGLLQLNDSEPNERDQVE